MKAKIIRGAGFGGCSRYLLQEGKGAEIIGGNLTGQTAQAIAEEFRRVANQRPDIEKPVWHSPLSAAPGERYSDEKWNAIVDDYLKGLGFNLDKTAYIIVRHTDKPHDHVHIEASRVALDGSLYLGKNENLKATKLTQQLEKKYGLIRTQGPVYDVAGKIVMPDKTKLRPNELRMQKCTGEIPPRERLQEILSTTVKGRPTQQEYEKRLTQAGVSYKFSSNGYSYQLDDITYKGSQLGSAYKWSQLQKSFTTAEQIQQRDLQAARTAAWTAEQQRRSKYRANRSISRSLCQLSYTILPRPLGEATQIAVDLVSLIAKMNDWREANIYRYQVKKLTAQMNQVKIEAAKRKQLRADFATKMRARVKADKLAVAEKSKLAQVQFAPVQIEPVHLNPVSPIRPVVVVPEAQSEALQVATKTILTLKPAVESVVEVPFPSLTAAEIKLLGQANWEMLRYGENRRVWELQAITHPGLDIDVHRKPCPILVNGVPITEIENHVTPASTQGITHTGRRK